MAKTNHVHKFKRLKYKSGNITFFCTLPDCTAKINPALALGKRSICWRCEEPFVMTEYSLRLAKPHCENCHKPKNGNTVNQINNPQTQLSPNHPAAQSLAERLEQTLKGVSQLPQEIEDEI